MNKHVNRRFSILISKFLIDAKCLPAAVDIPAVHIFRQKIRTVRRAKLLATVDAVEAGD